MYVYGMFVGCMCVMLVRVQVEDQTKICRAHDANGMACVWAMTA